MSRLRALTFDERIRWGSCPVCGVQDGQYCHGDVGVPMGLKVDGSRLKTGEGVHLGRLQSAPLHVREVPA